MSDDYMILPDGSACGVISLPLPADHWIYSPRAEWDSQRDEYADCPLPVLPNDMRPAVIAAAKYAIRAATMRGQDMDFDPDALVQLLVYTLCKAAERAGG